MGVVLRMSWPIAFKMMNSALQMMNYVSKMMNSALQMMNSVSKMMNSASKTMNSALKMMGSVLNTWILYLKCAGPHVCGRAAADAHGSGTKIDGFHARK